MTRIVFLLFAALLAGCSTSQPQRFWDASAMAGLPYPMVTLKEKSTGKVSGTIKMADIQQMIQIKEQVESAAGPINAALLLAEGNEPNGFSFLSKQGPIIAVNIGMVNLLDQDKDAMAALIGHELAHLYLNHGRVRRDREENRMAASVALSFVLGAFGVPLPMEVTDVATTSVTSKYSREEERDADKLGVLYMVRAGFDPQGSVRLQEKLGAASGSASLPFLSSHPGSAERVENMKRLAMEYQSGQPAVPPEKQQAAPAAP